MNPPSTWRWLQYGEPQWPEGGRTHLSQGVRELLMGLREFHTEAGSQDDLIEALENLDELRDEATRLITLIVAEARSSGVTWTSIGRALNVGRTAAQKRFSAVHEAADEVAAKDLERALRSAEATMMFITSQDERTVDQAEELLQRYGRDRVNPHDARRPPSP